MSHRVCIGCGLILVSVLFGCDSDSSKTYTLPETSETESSTAKTPSTSTNTMIVEGMNLIRYSDTLNENQELKPSFMLNAEHAKEITNENKSKHYEMTRPKAIIFTDDQEELNLHAESGVWNDDSETATLDGGVKLFSTQLNLTMQSIVWDNKLRTARSDTPIKFNTDQTDLTASGLTLHPNTGQLILTNVSGTLRLGASE